MEGALKRLLAEGAGAGAGAHNVELGPKIRRALNRHAWHANVNLYGKGANSVSVLIDENLSVADEATLDGHLSGIGLKKSGKGVWRKTF